MGYTIIDENEDKQPKEKKGYTIIEDQLAPTPFLDKVLNRGKSIAKTTGGFLEESALPIIGGAAAQILTRNPKGMAIGTGIGRIATEELQNVAGRQKKSQADIFAEGALETVFNYGADKALSKVTPAMLQPFKQAFEDWVAVAPTGKGGFKIKSFLNATGNLLSNLGRVVPKGQVEDAIDDMTLKLESKYGIPTRMTRRMFEAGPNNVLDPKNLKTKWKGTPKEEIAPETIKRVSGITESISKGVQDEYEKKLGDIIKPGEVVSSEETVPIIYGYMDGMYNRGQGLLKEPISKVKGRYVAKAKYASDQVAINKLTKLYGNLEEYINTGKPVELKQLHEFKRVLNDVYDSPSIQGSKGARDYVLDVKNKIVNVLDSKNDLYKQTNNEYRQFIELRDQLKGLDDTNKTHTLIDKYFDPKAVSLRDNLDAFLSKDKKSEKIFNDALNEATAVKFVSTFSKNISGGVTIPVPAGPIAARVGMGLGGGAKTAEGEAFKLLGRWNKPISPYLGAGSVGLLGAQAPAATGLLRQLYGGDK